MSPCCLRPLSCFDLEPPIGRNVILCVQGWQHCSFGEILEVNTELKDVTKLVKKILNPFLTKHFSIILGP